MEGTRRSDRLSTGAMEIFLGSSKTFLPARSAFPERVSSSARGTSRGATSPNFSSLRVVSVDSLAPPGKSLSKFCAVTDCVLSPEERSAFFASRSSFRASGLSKVSICILSSSVGGANGCRSFSRSLCPLCRPSSLLLSRSRSSSPPSSR